MTSITFASVEPVSDNDECFELSMFDCDGEAGACYTSFGTPFIPPVLLNFTPVFGGAPVGVIATCDTQPTTLTTGVYQVSVVNPGNLTVSVDYKYSFCGGSVEDGGTVSVGANSTVAVGFIFIP